VATGLLEADEELNTVPGLRSPIKKIKSSKMAQTHKSTIKRQFADDYDVKEVCLFSLYS
jgi:hypothetical protein